MKATKNNQLDQLFIDWQKQYGNLHFCKDGIINEEKYNKAKPKILFITKEPNDPDNQTTDYRTWYSQEVYYTFSYRIAEWAYGILNDFPPYDEIWPKRNGKYDDSKALEAIQSIAFMNVKKSGGNGSSIADDINKFISRDKDFIYKQIEIIDPEIIIAGMSWGRTLELLFPDKIVQWKPTGYAIDVGKFNRAKVIDFYHPSARNGVSASYCLLKTVMETDIFKNL